MAYQLHNCSLWWHTRDNSILDTILHIFLCYLGISFVKAVQFRTTWSILGSGSYEETHSFCFGTKQSWFFNLLFLFLYISFHLNCGWILLFCILIYCTSILQMHDRINYEFLIDKLDLFYKTTWALYKGLSCR